jgi:hypothetical protein
MHYTPKEIEELDELLRAQDAKESEQTKNIPQKKSEPSAYEIHANIAFGDAALDPKNLRRRVNEYRNKSINRRLSTRDESAIIYLLDSAAFKIEELQTKLNERSAP